MNKVEHVLSIPLMSVLTLIFITLKLCNQIDWSWWWVFAPLWIPVVLITLLVLVLVFIGLG